jgi:hypothetical protein
MQPAYYFCTENKLVQRSLEKRGWKLTYDFNLQCDLIFRISDETRFKFKENPKIRGKVINSFFGKRTLFKYLNKVGYAYIPKTYTSITDIIVDQKSDQDDQGDQNVGGKSTNWFYKKSNSSCGCGIKIASNIKELETIAVDRYYIIQKQVDNPLLYGGKKFDLRVYIVPDSIGNIYMYRIFGVRVNNQQYINSSKSNRVQLTNVSQGSSITPTSSLEGPLPDLLYNSVLRSVKSLADALPKEVEHKTTKLMFSLLGADFIIDSRGSALLLEINNNPFLNINGLYGKWKQTQMDMISELVEYFIEPYLLNSMYAPETGNWIKVR